MCRYSDHPYKTHRACFRCRLSFKRPRFSRVDLVCPKCGGKTWNMGRDFKAPRQKDKRRWRTVERLRKAGVSFDSCGCGGPGYRPTRPWQVDAWLNKRTSLPWSRGYISPKGGAQLLKRVGKVRPGSLSR